MEELKALGMVDAFTQGVADFSGINTKKTLFINEVLHKAFIEVDEYGTEAAAATAVIMYDAAAPQTTADFNADRPFLFFIRDTSGLILFSGQVIDPSA